MIGVAKKRSPSATSGTIGNPVMWSLGCHHSPGTTGRHEAWNLGRSAAGGP